MMVVEGQFLLEPGLEMKGAKPAWKPIGKPPLGTISIISETIRNHQVEAMLSCIG